MKFILLLSFLVFFCFSHAQLVKIDEIKLKPNHKLFNTKDSTIVYPIIVTKNTAVGKIINDEIRLQMIDEAYNEMNTQKALSELINERLTNLFYEVTFKNSNILSMKISAEGCGAYSSWSYSYFNFDLKTGKTLTIDDIVEEKMYQNLETIVHKDKRTALEKYKKEEFELFSNKEIDSTTYNWAIEHVDENCVEGTILSVFSLSSFGIEFIDPCEFPHVLRSQTPTYELKYSYKVISQFLKPEFKNRLK
jgi:hypothetical protein